VSSATVSSIAEDALREIGAIGVGESLTPPYERLVLTRFQNQLDAWQTDALTLYTFSRRPYVLPRGTSITTIGPSGDITTQATPVYLNGINFVVPGSNPPVETPMGEMDQDGYMALSIKGLSSALPTQWFFNAGPTNGTLTFWPVVTQDVTLAIYANYGVSVPVRITDTVTGPPGYAEAFMYGLAIRLCTPFGRPVPPLLPQMAMNAYRALKRPNTTPGLLGVDAGLIGGGGAYNILNDQSSHR